MAIAAVPVARGWARRHRVITALVVVVLALSPWEASLAWAVTGPGAGSLSGRAADWFRDHGGASTVAWIENLWYSHHQPPRGGRPPAGAIPAGAPAVAGAGVHGPHLPPPAAISPLVFPGLPGEGLWRPVGRPVHGLSAVYEAFLRPDSVHTSLVAGVAWMDTTRLRASLYAGSYIPGRGPWTLAAPISPPAAASLVAVFNSGFRMKDARGGYFEDGRTAMPLVNGAASFVIYRDGRATVAQWGRDATMSPDVVAVRQNLRLLVDHGAPVPGLDGRWAWGATLGDKVYVWRSGVGVTADGALVYAAGPGLDAPSLADLLVRAGAVRAMELDINTDWVNLSVYSPATPGAPATPANGSTLLPEMRGGTGRYFQPWWNRDFITMSAAP